MNFPCPTHFDCEGVDDPVVNFSSEVPDQLLFASPIPRPPGGGFEPPPLNPDPTYYSKDCFGVVYSATSQEEADRLAKLASVDCNRSTTSNICYNDTAIATVECEDGSVFTYVVPAGTFASSYDDTPIPEPTTPPTPTPIPPPVEPPTPPVVQPTCVVTVNDYNSGFTTIQLKFYNLVAGFWYNVTITKATGPTLVRILAAANEYTYDDTYPGSNKVVGCEIEKGYPNPLISLVRSVDDLNLVCTNLTVGVTYHIAWEYNVGLGWNTFNWGNFEASSTSQTFVESGYFVGSVQVRNPTIVIIY